MKLYLVVGSLLVAAALVLLVNATTPLPKKKKTSPRSPISAGTQEALSRAQALAAQGEFLEAQKLLNQARSEDPRRPEIYLASGKIYLLAGLPQGAADEWNKGLEQTEDHPELLIHLASLALQTLRDPEVALAYLHRAQKASPQAPGLDAVIAEATALLAEKHRQSGDLLKAKSLLEEALAKDGECVAAQAVVARLAEAEDRWDEAADAWEKVFAAAPEPPTRRSLAESHKRLGYLKLVKNRDEAIRHFVRAVNLAAEGVDVTFLLDVLRQEADAVMEEGQKAYEDGDFAKAKERFAHSSSLVPENFLADNHLGLSLWKLEDREGAAAAWESSIDKAAKVGAKVDAVPTHKNLTVLYREMGKFTDAQRVGNAYLEKYPQGIYAAEIQSLIATQ